MYPTLPENRRASLRSMVGIEARRFARHPLFLVGAATAYVVTGLVSRTDDPFVSDVLAWPIVPGFFIGLTSLVVAASLTRSTEASVEAMGTAPGTEARRTLAVAGACLVPFLAGLVWLAEVAVLLGTGKGLHPNEWWFGTMNDAYVVSILLALGPVACLGGGLLGVLVGRWVGFRGAPAVAVVAVVAIDMFGQMPYAYTDQSEARLWVPWAMWHSGSMDDNTYAEVGATTGTTMILPGNPALYLVYVLVLCALAVGGAVWHDRTARSRTLRFVLIGLIALAAAALALTMTTGIDEIVVNDPLPFKLGDRS